MTPPQTTRNLEEFTRQIIGMMDIMPSDFERALRTGQKNQCGSKIDMSRRKQAREHDERAQQGGSSFSSLYQSLHRGNSYNTVVGFWFVISPCHDAVWPQESKFPQELQRSSIVAAAPDVQHCSLIYPKSTSHTGRSANASLPREPATTSTIWIRCLCYDS